LHIFSRPNSKRDIADRLRGIERKREREKERKREREKERDGRLTKEIDKKGKNILYYHVRKLVIMKK